MRVVLAESYGMCFGVRDAIALALNSPQREQLTVLGELVHNQEVLHTLRNAGVRSLPSIEAALAGEVETSRVLITAHGASGRAVAALRERGLEVLEATCPLVRHAHRSLQKLVRQGYFPVVIGKPDHVEVRGLVGDLDAYRVIQSVEEIPLLAGHTRLGVASQTTQPLDFVLKMVDAIRAAFPETEVRFLDTVCQPTKERQAAVRRLASGCEVVIVVGGRTSNNTRQLVETCEREGARAYQVESAADLCPEWLAGADTVGLTAGTSTPDRVIREVHNALLAMAEPHLREAA